MHTDYTTWKAQRRWVTSGNQKEEARPEADHEGGEGIIIRTQWGVTTCQIQTSTPPSHTGGKPAPWGSETAPSENSRQEQIRMSVCTRTTPTQGASWAQLTQQPPAPHVFSEPSSCDKSPSWQHSLPLHHPATGKQQARGLWAGTRPPLAYTHTHPALTANKLQLDWMFK